MEKPLFKVGDIFIDTYCKNFGRAKVIALIKDSYVLYWIDLDCDRSRYFDDESLQLITPLEKALL